MKNLCYTLEGRITISMKKSKKERKFKVLDLFCGCGGLSLGFSSHNYEVVAGIDNWKDALITFEKNHPNAKGILADLNNVNFKALQKKIGKIDVVIGGPPCQGYSISGKRNPNDPRNKLYKGFVKMVETFRPAAFVLENVPNLVSMSGGKFRDTIISDFNSLGYKVNYKVLLASDFGVPQNRKRVFFVGVLNNKDFEFPEGSYITENKKITCEQALSDLPDISIEDGAENLYTPKTRYQRSLRSKTNKLYNHQLTNHSEKTINTIALVPDGGNYKNLPEKLRNSRKVNIAWTRYSSKKPSLTIDTGHRHHFHYKFNRVPTVRESARLQSFPDDFIFYGSKTSQYKQVGNAVPPMMAAEIAESLYKILIDG